MAYRAATKDDRAVMLAAVSAGLIPDTMSARSQFLNEVKRDINAARVKVAAASAARRPAAVAASSAKSTDTHKPATVTRERVKPSGGTTPKVTTERIKTRSASVVSPQPTRAAAPATTAVPTEYPSSWMRGRRAAGAGAAHRPATITAARQTSVQRAAQAHQATPSVHAAGGTTQLIQAQRRRDAAQIAESQASRAGYYDRHDLITASGANARRLAEAQRAEVVRMQREQRARASR